MDKYGSKLSAQEEKVCFDIIIPMNVINPLVRHVCFGCALSVEILMLTLKKVPQIDIVNSEG